jgi:hypothetical protein
MYAQRFLAIIYLHSTRDTLCSPADRHPGNPVKHGAWVVDRDISQIWQTLHDEPLPTDNAVFDLLHEARYEYAHAQWMSVLRDEPNVHRVQRIRL